MKTFKLILLTPACLLFLLSCDKKQAETETVNYLVINEVAAHEETGEVDSWVEIANTGTETVSLEGMGLYITDKYLKGQKIAALSGSLEAGARLVVSTSDNSLVTGIASDTPFTLVLGTSASDVADTFSLEEEAPSLGYFGSYQRIPDLSGDWRLVTYSSPGRENALFDISNYKPTAVWTWGAHLADLTANDGAKLREIKNKGYDHILLNFAGFETAGYHSNALKFIRICDEIDLVPHVWMQCFYEGGKWISPIDDENVTYKEDVYERIRNDADRYIRTWGVKGVHLDYIRFGGTASKHDHNREVNSVGAVNRCCREIRETTDSFDEGLVTSAALMPEPNSTATYGQSPNMMAEYIHILMPMIYRYGSYNFSDDTFQSRSNYFADQAAKKGGVSWSGIQTYNASNQGMTATQLRRDIDLMADTRAAGVVLFRYQLGEFPDINDLWK